MRISPCGPLPVHSPASCLKRSRPGFAAGAFLSGCACETSPHTDSARTSDATILHVMSCSFGIGEEVNSERKDHSIRNTAAGNPEHEVFTEKTATWTLGIRDGLLTYSII